ncbi:MAG: cytochrome c biogenesis protein ResB [Gammaproteobacteria bacterium]
MIPMVRALGSVRLALLGMVLLALGAALSYNNPVSTPVWVLVVPLAFLAVNLLAAIATNPRINRRAGLLIFHIGLLSIIVLAGVGRLTHLDAQLEITEGGAFSPQELSEVNKGPFHSGALDKIAFVQGSYTVEYAAGMVRGLTHSQVLVPDGRGGVVTKVVGDDRPLVLEGYRFYTTFNKGFAPVLTWLPDTAPREAITGTVHMPSYPLFEYKQDSTWTPPGGKEIKLWLRLKTGLREDAPWVLDGKGASGVLVVNSGVRRVELQPGETVQLEGGKLRYERLTSWMGYKVFYDPTLHWLFASAMVAIIGLGSHFWGRFGARLQHTPAPSAGASLKHVSASEISGGRGL